MFRPRVLRALPRGRLQPVRTVTPRRTFIRQRSFVHQPTEKYNINQLSEARTSYDRDRTYFLAAGAIAGIISFVYTANKLRKALAAEKKRKAAGAGGDGSSDASADQRTGYQLDSSVPSETFTTEAGSKRKVVIHDDEGKELVPTGNKTVPSFPRTIELSSKHSASSRDPEAAAQAPIAASVQDSDGVEYTLVGLGIRTVSFLSIQVYMVGYYVATQDVAKLQHYLTKKINPIATTLVPSERDTLKEKLLDPAEGEETWTALLQEVGCRSAFRIVPVRDTDFPHLRDGFVRAITHRSAADKEAYGDEAFGEAMRDFKRLFSRGKVPKSKELLLCRDEKGALEVIYDDGRSFGRQSCGKVQDERVSRLLWLNWLAGKKVASEPARTSIIDGVMEFVERPVGTVAAQVV
ncbi:Altered inheritance of mitochondria protein 18 [Colletotrichum siamense]|uniref:Altered inheritance of mitochondria protein 18 n=1 Tax=Colletotrichum siamense TaxID=690259 RepID=A0A9P5BN16_COLSI|nr:Altered inheritance of mitochondria protein 18 [Colletotrichum siamense]KAF4831774.1 Altered inheritance of mitochondria protein 18 [Colletotrichum siamense]KAF4844729.1 Altered inheritance of mitochondria protein 18 [Colletotrichum siamense]KAF5497081.1 Altered inheritance of mitochondria protein 18 [Colletotrichum siamense]